MSLDHRFFELIRSTQHRGGILQSYKAVYARSTMVLFSRKSRTPLAGLTLSADDVGCLSMLTGRPAPPGAPETYFQGMLNMPDQSFAFTITNLSNEGMINFNILHSPHKVSEVDPGPTYGVNEVNELSRNESYTIQADQRTNRRMVLTGMTTTVKDPETSKERKVALTVKESEKRRKPQGLYFYLNVVPDRTCKSLVEKFAEGTAWKVVSGFVRREPRQSKPPHPAPVDVTAQEQQLDQLMASLQRLRPLTGVIDNEARMQNLCLDASSTPSLVTSLAGRVTHAYSAMIRGPSTKRESSSNPRSLKRSEMGAGSRFVAPVDVGRTQVGELAYGQRVNVTSAFTGHEYAYDHSSEATVLCMPLWDNMKFLPLSKTVEEELSAEVKELMENEGKALVESLNAIFKAKTCVIDLESEADTIVCSCGHQCLNHTNIGALRLCPVCRSPITAFVRADGVVVG